MPHTTDPGVVRTMIPGVYLLPDGRYLVRVTWSPCVGDRKHFYQKRRVVGSLEDARRARLELRDELRSNVAPVELLDPQGASMGRVYRSRVIADRPPTSAPPLPPSTLFEAEE